VPHHRSPRLTFALRISAVITGVAVCTASSCLTPTTPTAQFGDIGGVVSNSQGFISGATVTAVSDSGGEYVATTDANGNYLITNVPDGSGSVSLSVLPAGCSVPNPVAYTVAGADTANISITVTCTAVIN
jgi:hypothetical protein